MPKETKRQHFVPRTYLRKFGIKKKDNFKISVVDKSDLSKMFFTNIENVCIENDFYTLKGKTEEERQLVEAFYSDELESQYDEVYRILTDPKSIEIETKIHEKIVATIITMMYRTSRWVHLHNDFVDKVLEKLFSLCNQKKTDYFIYENSRYSIANKSLKQVQCEFHKQAKDYQIVTQLDTALKLISIRKYDGLLVSKLANEHHLITSDNPVILSNIVPGRIAPFDPENMLSLPIDHTHLLTILPHSQTDSSHRIMRLHINGGMSAGKMIVNNGSQFTSCQKHLLGSKSGLTEYYKNKEKYESPITEEQANNLDSIYKKARDLGIIK